MKKKKRAHIISFFMFMLILSCGKGKSGCRDLEYLQCLEDKTFTGHMIINASVIAPGIEECQIRCFGVHDCVSYNLGPINGLMRTCELSSSDHLTFPVALKDIKGHEYCPIKNRCSSKPCPASKPLCYPDFAWDKHTCRDGVWSQWGLWSSCICASRTRICKSTSGGQAQDCGPGPKMETSACPTPKGDLQQCSKALGMEDKCIPDSHVTASSDNGAHCAPHLGRLHRKHTTSERDGSWCAKYPGHAGDFLQVNLGSTRTVTKIATQGRYIEHASWTQFVTRYTISYSTDGATWDNYGNSTKIFQGNTDKHSVVTNQLSPPITAQYIRVIVKEFKEHPSMRIELYGC